MTQLVGTNLLVKKSGNQLDCGDIIIYDFGLEPDPTGKRAGREQAKSRPAIVITPLTFNSKTGNSWVCPITSREKDCDFRMPLPDNLNTDGFIILDNLRSIKSLSNKTYDFYEQAPFNLVSNIIDNLKKIIPNPSSIKTFPTPLINRSNNTHISKYYKPNSGEIITYSLKIESNPVFQRGNKEQSFPHTGIVITPLNFNIKTKLAWVCPIIPDKKDYIFEIPLPDELSTKGVILSDQLNSLDWEIRNFKPIDQATPDLTKNLLNLIHMILQ